MPTLYYDYLSQPSRAIVMFCEAAGIEYTPHEVSIIKGEHKQPEYREKVNKFEKLPAWQEDDGEIYIESSSILRFLASKHNVTEFWPENLSE